MPKLDQQAELSAAILSDVVTHMKYSRFVPELERRENWTEIVDRTKQMHTRKFPHLSHEIDAAFAPVYEKKVLGSMRGFQFGGKAIELNPARLYNCAYLAVDHPDAFSETFFLLLSGCGVGYSVQRHHIEKLPEIVRPTKTKRYLVGDSIEGWADSVKVLMNAYLTGKPSPVFDFRAIRAKGTPLLTSGGVAPGPEDLKTALHHIQTILDRKQTGDNLSSLEVHDIMCHISDAVMSGGIRRAAMISLFDADDDEMLTCKFGKWYETDPQRGRANNSAVLLRHKIDKKFFLNLWAKIQASGSGEPGFLFSNDKEVGTNPCGEVSLRSCQFCNLTNVNSANIEDQEDLNARAKAASAIGTIQASYTDFHYLRDIWKKTTEKDALIGVSLAGIAAGKVLELNMEEAAEVVKDENARVAKLLGINKAARCTVIKPDGHTSLVLGASSGVHAYHAEYYVRRVKIEKSSALYSYLSIHHPELLEDDFFKPTKEAFVVVPQKAPEGAITREEPALDMLERVRRLYTEWIKGGYRKGANQNNVSATVTIKADEWEKVGEWMWKHRDEFTALSIMPFDGHTYKQTPFTDSTKTEYQRLVKTLKEINLNNVIETRDRTTLKDTAACAAGGCEI